MNKKNAGGLAPLLGRGAKVEISPAVVASRSWHTFVFKITLGAGGLAPGDSLGMLCGSNIDRWQFQFASHIWGCYTPWQTHDPAAPNFLTAACARGDAPLDVRIGGSGGLKLFQNQPDHFVHSLVNRCRYVLEIISRKRLRQGETITIKWGDPICGSPGVQAPALAFSYYFFPFKFSLLPASDRDLPIRKGDFDALPSIRVTGGTATRLHIAASPLAARGEPVRVHCAAVDEYGNLDENFRGTVRVNLSGKTAAGPARVSFTGRHGGRRKIDGIRFDRTGWQHIVLSSGAIKSPPHPVWVSRAKPRERIYFGEMHAHTLNCDGTCRSEDHYSYAREVAGLDFCSLASHAEYFGSKPAWQKYLRAATRAHVPGRFIVFYGYEWAGQGHINAYFLAERDAVNIYGKRILKGRHPKDAPAFRIACNQEQRFLQLIKSLDRPVFCITHFHSAYAAPAGWPVVWLHEVYSMHQQNPRDKMLQAILAQGLKIGVVAGSDSHRLPIGSLCPDPDRIWRQPLSIAGHIGSQSVQKKCGLQAVFASALSRPGIYHGMQKRFTYGTTGARMVLLFEVGGARMGAGILVAAGAEPELIARVGGSSKLAEVCVLQYDGKKWSTPIRKTNLGAMTCNLKCRLPPVKTDLVYYLRATQVDGEQAWSSPVWIKKASALSPADRCKGGHCHFPDGRPPGLERCAHRRSAC